MSTEDRHTVEELLRSELRAPEFPADEVQGRIRRTIAEGDPEGSATQQDPAPSDVALRARPSAIARWTGAVAAALLLFVAGAEYGRRSAVSTVSELTAVREGARGLPLAIQASGSSYVARLAELGASSSSATERERELAREVAWATLHGAMVELARQSDMDEELRAMIRLVESTRHREGGDRRDAVLRF